MGSLSSSRVVRIAAVVGLAVGAPAACFFPSYTYDLPDNAGGSGGTSTHSSTSKSTTSTSDTTSSTSDTSSTSVTSTTSTGPTSCPSNDCSDPMCAGILSCVPAAPSGWMGFFALYDGPASSDPGCPNTFPTSAFLGNNNINVTTPTCSTCTCTNPQGMKCGMTGTADSQHANTIDAIVTVDAQCNGNINCGGPLEVPTTWDGSCYGPDGLPAGTNTCGANSGATCNMGTGACNQAIQVTPLAVSGGSCTPSQQTPVIKPVGWDIAGEACGDAATNLTGCNNGLTCMPKPQAPFVSGVCIYKDGDNSCPPGQFSQQHVFYTDKTDTRGCTACTCDAPAGASCSATVTVYSNQTINSCDAAHLIATLNPTTAAGDCVNITGNPATVSRKAVFTAPTGGSCAMGGGVPMGTAVPAAPRTYCCIP